MEIIEASPKASTHIKTLQKIGYSFNSAISDIIDNSITAEAKVIKINFYFDSAKISISDDGYGMSSDELKSNMIIGCKDPFVDRSKKDLGRFGTGLKTASFSMCNKLTVLSKKENDKIFACQYDINQIIESNEWQLNILDLKDLDECKPDLINELGSGTEVIWQEITRYESFNNNEIEEAMAHDADELRKHISLHFHKYLSGPLGIKILINNVDVVAHDPFFKNKKGYQEGQIESARSKLGTIIVKTHIIPHHDHMTKEEIDHYGGLEKIHGDQGLYIYREKRLITYGGWAGLKPKFSIANLARVEVEVPAAFDHEWSTNVMKTSLELPNKIRNMIKRLIVTPIKRSKRAYTYRGDLQEAGKFWSVITNRDSEITYKVDTTNSQLLKVLENSSHENQKLILGYVKSLSENLPLDSIVDKMVTQPKNINQKDITYDLDEIMQHLEAKLLEASDEK